MLYDLRHRDETCICGDRAYRGPTDVIKRDAPSAQGFTHCRYRHRSVVDTIERAKNETKSKMLAKLKLAIGGLDENARRLFVTCALANLFISRRQLLRWQGR